MTSGPVPGSLIIHTVVLIQAEPQHILPGHPGRVMGSEQYPSSGMLYGCQSVDKVGSILNLVTSSAPQQALHPPMFTCVLRGLSITDPFLLTFCWQLISETPQTVSTEVMESHVFVEAAWTQLKFFHWQNL